MSTIVLMKAFESVPGRYDLGMRLITFGEITELRRAVAAEVPAGARVLDIGCGTGALLPLLAKRGARVTAIDKSSEMVTKAHERAGAEGILESVCINRATAMEIDRLFPNGEFDAVILSLVMTELTKDEQAWVLNQCARILKPNGSLLIADEFKPARVLDRLAFEMFRFPLHLIAYLYTQIKGLVTSNIWWRIYYTLVELPLMLLSFFVGEPLTAPLHEPETFLPGAFRVTGTKHFWGGAIRLLKIQKADLG
jgi:demethylmenaquinone methyltransferase/2-methoxy-6-polyprenyl-1,4-benzoquinol methylase